MTPSSREKAPVGSSRAIRRKAPSWSPRGAGAWIRKPYLFRNQELATRALRVIGFAIREFQGEVPSLTEETLEVDLTFLGLAGMMDAPRSDAIDAIRRCKKAGIRVVMITGDHKLTAMAVAREMGILEEGYRALSGEELEKLSDADLVREAERIRV